MMPITGVFTKLSLEANFVDGIGSPRASLSHKSLGGGVTLRGGEQ